MSANPLPNDADRAAIWTMLVDRDIAAFVAADGSLVEGDFIEEMFFGIDGTKPDNPDGWRIGFPTLAACRDEWLRQAKAGQAVAYAEDPSVAIHRATSLTDIEIYGDAALAHKKFDGTIKLVDGGAETLNWQTLYFCRKQNDVWKLTRLAGYLPYSIGKAV